MSILYCANCQETAIYIYRVTKSSSIPYCFKDLPKFLKSPKYAGSVVKVSDLPKTFNIPEPTKEVSSKSTKKKSAPVVEEKDVVEETVVEETVVEEVSSEVTEAE
jgi:hypothetical protein